MIYHISQIAWLQAGKSITDLDSNDSLYLETIADTATGEAKLTAENMLAFAFNKEYCNCIEEIEGTVFAHHPFDNDDTESEKQEQWFRISPNPASIWLAMNYTMPRDCQTIYVTISNEEGKRIQTFQLFDKAGQKVIDTRSFAKGVYFYEAKAGNKTSSGKIIIQ